MKTRILKIVLPVFAILLAVSFAFAAETTTEAKTAYFFHPVLGWQSVAIGDDCNKPAGEACKIGTFQLYGDRSTSNPLHRTAP